MDSIAKQNNLPLDLQEIIYQFLYPNPKINYNKVVLELIHTYNSNKCQYKSNLPIHYNLI